MTEDELVAHLQQLLTERLRLLAEVLLTVQEAAAILVELDGEAFVRVVNGIVPPGG